MSGDGYAAMQQANGFETGTWSRGSLSKESRGGCGNGGMRFRGSARNGVDRKPSPTFGQSLLEHLDDVSHSKLQRRKTSRNHINLTAISLHDKLPSVRSSLKFYSLWTTNFRFIVFRGGASSSSSVLKAPTSLERSNHNSPIGLAWCVPILQ
jgi:hypothetical protein